MNPPVYIGPHNEEAYRRRAIFAIDVLDGVTLQRIGRDVKMVVEGLTRQPVLNFSGLHVWVNEDLGNLRRIAIDPQKLPYEAVELSPQDIAEIVQAAQAGEARITTVQLPPRAGQPLPDGLTMLRGVVLESASNPVPLLGAAAKLEWLDGTDWKSLDAEFPIRSTSGTFIAVLRLPLEQDPQPDADGNVTVRVRVRVGAAERRSSEGKLAWGKATEAASPFYWNDLYLYP